MSYFISIVIVALLSVAWHGARTQSIGPSRALGSGFTIFRNDQDFGDLTAEAQQQNPTAIFSLLGQYFNIPETGAGPVGDEDGATTNSVTAQRTNLINSATVAQPPAPVQFIRVTMNSGLRR